MQITKLEHSGIIIEKSGKKIVFDPVEFAETLPKLENVVAIIITHAHSDHLQPDKISAILDLNPTAKVFAPQDALELLPDATVAASGEEIEVDGFHLQFFGKDHAAIFTGKVPCANLGVVVDDVFTNPGDSLDLPDNTINVLCVPEAAPWEKISETVQYVKTAQPQVVIPVHNGILSDMGKTIYNNFLRNICEDLGITFAPLAVGETIDL